MRRSSAFPGVRYFVCASCGTVGAFPVPSERDLGTYYKNLYLSTWKRSSLDRAIQIFRRWSEAARADSILNAGGVEPGSGRMRMVDVGAGNGALTRALRGKLGPAARIVAVDAAKEVLRLGAWADETWRLSESALVRKLGTKTARRFDVIFFSHTLEHFREPARVLGAFARRLAPGGRIVVDFPHGLHPHYRSPSDIQIPDLYFFSLKGISKLAERAGLRVLAHRGLSPGPDALASRPDAASQYAASGFFIARRWLLGEGYSKPAIPLWYRVVLTPRL